MKKISFLLFCLINLSTICHSQENLNSYFGIGISPALCKATTDEKGLFTVKGTHSYSLSYNVNYSKKIKSHFWIDLHGGFQNFNRKEILTNTLLDTQNPSDPDFYNFDHAYRSKNFHIIALGFSPHFLFGKKILYKIGLVNEFGFMFGSKMKVISYNTSQEIIYNKELQTSKESTLAIMNGFTGGIGYQYKKYVLFVEPSIKWFGSPLGGLKVKTNNAPYMFSTQITLCKIL